MILSRGSVILVELDPTLGREQRCFRPCVVISDPEVSSVQRYPLVCVVPITGTAGQGMLYPRLSPGASGLTKFSYALIDHLRSIDKCRVKRVLGALKSEEQSAVDVGIASFLGLEAV